MPEILTRDALGPLLVLRVEREVERAVILHQAGIAAALGGKAKTSTRSRRTSGSESSSRITLAPG
jgi:hypothetical protein